MGRETDNKGECEKKMKKEPLGIRNDRKDGDVEEWRKGRKGKGEMGRKR